MCSEESGEQAFPVPPLALLTRKHTCQVAADGAYNALILSLINTCVSTHAWAVEPVPLPTTLVEQLRACAAARILSAQDTLQDQCRGPEHVV